MHAGGMNSKETGTNKGGRPAKEEWERATIKLNFWVTPKENSQLQAKFTLAKAGKKLQFAQFLKQILLAKKHVGGSKHDELLLTIIIYLQEQRHQLEAIKGMLEGHHQSCSCKTINRRIDEELAQNQGDDNPDHDMVIRILTGKDVAGAVRYNEQKVALGDAERIHVANYPDAEIAQKHARFRLQLLEQYARLNPNVRKPSVHIAVAFHPTEPVTSDQLRTIGHELMTEAGYGKQPYLMYQHHDTRHPHIHIVTVGVDGRGNKISDKFIQKRLQQIRRRLESKYDLVRAEGPQLIQKFERVGEGDLPFLPTRRTVSDQLKRTLEMYSFGSVNSLKQYLRGEGIEMNLKAGRSQSGITYQQTDDKGANNRPVRASSIPSRPTRERLMELFASQADRHKKGCKALADLMTKRLASYRILTEMDFKQSLRQLGIEVIETEGSYLYIQKEGGVVAQEAELGRPYSRQVLSERFTNKTERLSTVATVTNILDVGRGEDKKAAAIVEQTQPHAKKRSGAKAGAGLLTTPQPLNAQTNKVEHKPVQSMEEELDTTGGLRQQAIKEESVENPKKKKPKKNRLHRTRRI